MTQQKYSGAATDGIGVESSVLNVGVMRPELRSL